MGYNQEGIAATVGMKQRTWSDWEKKPPDALQWLVNIGTKYSLSVDWLLGLTDNPTPNRNGIQPYPEHGVKVLETMRDMSTHEQEAILQIAKILREVESEARRAAMIDMLRSVMAPIKDLLGADAAEDFYQAVSLLRRTGDQSALLSWLHTYLGKDESGGDEE